MNGHVCLCVFDCACVFLCVHALLREHFVHQEEAQENVNSWQQRLANQLAKDVGELFIGRCSVFCRSYVYPLLTLK